MESAKIKMILLMRGNTGKEVATLKKALRKALGAGAAAYPGLAAGNEFDTATVNKLFPYTKTSSIARNLPYVTAALAAFGLTDANMISTALGTIRAETEGFVPIAELPSHFNTLPGQAAFSAYDHRLGN